MTATPAKTSFENMRLFQFVQLAQCGRTTSNRTGGNGVQVVTENEKVTAMCSHHHHHHCCRGPCPALKQKQQQQKQETPWFLKPNAIFFLTNC